LPLVSWFRIDYDPDLVYQLLDYRELIERYGIVPPEDP